MKKTGKKTTKTWYVVTLKTVNNVLLLSSGTAVVYLFLHDIAFSIQLIWMSQILNGNGEWIQISFFKEKYRNISTITYLFHNRMNRRTARVMQSFLKSQFNWDFCHWDFYEGGIQKKENNIRDACSTMDAFIHFHLFASIYPLSLISSPFIFFHPLSSTFIDPRSPTFIHFYPFSSTFI